VRDPFKLGGDIDAVSRATITMESAVRAVQKSSRMVARALLTPPGARP
jgi:Na+-translocating ferredoxin:NAD+ oxidoreductase RnfG subunit